MLIFKLVSGVFIDVTDDGMVVMGLDQGAVIFLGELESKVFTEVIGGTEQQLIDKLKNEYEGDGIEDDIRKFLLDLRQYGILELVED